jgi:hypothetical protein
MDIGDWQASKELDKVFADVREFDLVSNIAELEAYGFTVVEPRKVKSPALFDADAKGRRMSKLVGTDGTDYSRILYALILQDPLFAEAVMHPVALTLGRYLMGASCRLYTTSAFVKKGKAAPTHLHTDSAGTPPPLYPYGLVCNISWILTDYTKDRGTFAMVPGSHRYCRHPTPIEQPKMMGGPNDEICVPIEAEPGSLIVFNGNTWHGTYPKVNEEFRAHVVTGYCRNYILPAEKYDDVAPSLLEKYGAPLSHLLSRNTWQGFTEEGPNSDNLARIWPANYTPSA